jgi:dihydroorotase
MPNNEPACTTVERLHEKLDRAAATSAVHYGFFIGATPDNMEALNAAERACGIKIFMGGSGGDLLVHEPENIERIFMGANKPIAVHAEDELRLRERAQLYEGTVDVRDHPRIRDAESALIATRRAVEFSLKHGQRLHILHVSSAEEVAFLGTVPRDNITAEVCPQNLFLHAEDVYDALGERAQCDPPVRTQRHARALWQGLTDGIIQCIATDHAPYALAMKQQGYPNTPSGMPGVEWSLPLMLDQVHRGTATLNQVARWMSEAPARCYGIPRKGRLETGYDGDFVLVDMARTKTITDVTTRSGCAWTPYDGWEVTGWPVLTAVMGRPVYRDGQIIEGVRGRELTYARN